MRRSCCRTLAFPADRGASSGRRSRGPACRSPTTPCRSRLDPRCLSRALGVSDARDSGQVHQMLPRDDRCEEGPSYARGFRARDPGIYWLCPLARPDGPPTSGGDALETSRTMPMLLTRSGSTRRQIETADNRISTPMAHRRPVLSPRGKRAKVTANAAGNTVNITARMCARLLSALVAAEISSSVMLRCGRRRLKSPTTVWAKIDCAVARVAAAASRSTRTRRSRF